MTASEDIDNLVIVPPEKPEDEEIPDAEIRQL